jgi:hypothetical protein
MPVEHVIVDYVLFSTSMYHSIVILIYPENGRLERAVCLYKILLQTGVKYNQHIQNV